MKKDTATAAADKKVGEKINKWWLQFLYKLLQQNGTIDDDLNTIILFWTSRADLVFQTSWLIFFSPSFTFDSPELATTMLLVMGTAGYWVGTALHQESTNRVPYQITLLHKHLMCAATTCSSLNCSWIWR